MKKYIIIVAVLSFFVLCSPSPEAEARSEDFFSEKRLFLNRALIEKMPGNGGAQRELSRFAKKYEDGLYALSGYDLDRAERDLLSARKIWPEYYRTDLALGLVYESRGQNALAARYYKSYLNKLRALYAGRYRISGPLMASLSRDEVERPSLAEEMVRERLEAHGIDIERVRPVITFPRFLFTALLGVFGIVVFVAVRYWLWPRIKLRERIKNPPEGFWVCSSCGGASPVLSRECQSCGRPRKEKG